MKKGNMNVLLFSLTLALILFSFTVLADVSELNYETVYTASGTVTDMEFVDIDGDGDNDTVTVGVSGGTLFLGLNNGTGNFTTTTIATGIGDLRAVGTGDLDTDGDIDIVTCGDGGNIDWWENDGLENFTQHAIPVGGVCFMNACAIRDIDGDADNDIVAFSSFSGACTGSPTVYWFENNGTESFTRNSIEPTQVGNGGRAMSVADFDGDSDLDLLTSYQFPTENVRWYKNNGTGTFTTHTIITNCRSNGNGVLDFDTDGDIDISFGCGEAGGLQIATIYENDGLGNFTHFTNVSKDFPTGVTMGDINNDTFIDIVATGTYFLNNGNFSFVEYEAGIGGSFIYRNHIVDIQHTAFPDYPALASGTIVVVTAVIGSPPPSSTILYGEDWGDGFVFVLNQTQCVGGATGGLSQGAFDGHFPKYVGGNYDWVCWDNATSGELYNYSSEYDTTKISSTLGIRLAQEGTPPYTSGWANLGSYNISMSATDRMLLTCDMSNASDSNSFLFFGATEVTGFPKKDESGLISLQNGGCAVNGSIPYHSLNTSGEIACCELINISGSDCSSGKISIDFSQQDVEDNCFVEELQDLQFQDIDRIEFLTLRTGSSGIDNVYFDDFYIYSPSIIGNNSLPNFIILTGLPNPANVSEEVKWGWNVFDPDDPANETYTAFDCEDDGVLEYGWDLRGNLGSEGTGEDFECTYSSEATFTGRLWFTDVFHFLQYNLSATNTVDVVLTVDDPAPVQGGDCISFTPPTCTGDCYFNDDFAYSNPVECNEWEATANDVNPTNGTFSVFGLPVSKFNIEIDGDTYSEGTIFETQYENFEVEFDFILSHDSNVQFNILDDSLTKYSAFVVFSNYNIQVFSPSLTTIDSVGMDELHNLRMAVNLADDEINYFVDDVFKFSGNFFDGASDSARKFGILWVSTSADFEIDNFMITFGNLSVNATIPEEEAEPYVYNPNLFCAVNWTGTTGNRFNEQNCVDRGFSVEYPLLSLCVPRACFQDVKFGIFNWATSNIFETIVIVTAFILIVPLLVALLKRK